MVLGTAELIQHIVVLKGYHFQKHAYVCAQHWSFTVTLREVLY